jgi:excisionase family DNA binding protein
MNDEVHNPDKGVRSLGEFLQESAPPLMTPQEVADFLQVPVATVQLWRSQRTGPRGYRVGRHVRYRRKDVESWLEQRAGVGPRR